MLQNTQRVAIHYDLLCLPSSAEKVLSGATAGKLCYGKFELMRLTSQNNAGCLIRGFIGT